MKVTANEMKELSKLSPGLRAKLEQATHTAEESKSMNKAMLGLMDAGVGYETAQAVVEQELKKLGEDDMLKELIQMRKKHMEPWREFTPKLDRYLQSQGHYHGPHSPK